MDLLRGHLCCAVAGVGFAVNYLPVKKFDTGDGIFFCAAMSIGILSVGLWTGMFLTSDGFPAFEPLAALGGALWMLGNLMCPQIIQMIGLGLGLTMWDLSNMLVGWLIGRFGLFGLEKDVVHEPMLNLMGLILAALSLVFFFVSSVLNVSPAQDARGPSCEPREPEAPIEPEDEESMRYGQQASKVEPEPLGLPRVERVQSWMSEMVHPRAGPSSCLEDGAKDEKADLIAALPGDATIFQLFFGSCMSITAGGLFGTTFVLPTALKEGIVGDHHSSDIMDYVFSHFLGIFITSTLALFIYLGIKREKSFTPLSIIVPAIWSGVIWGIAQVAWFQANLDLGFSVAFPMVASLPGVIGLAIGICCFKEVEGFHARIFVALGLLLRIPGMVFIAISA